MVMLCPLTACCVCSSLLAISRQSTCSYGKQKTIYKITQTTSFFHAEVFRLKFMSFCPAEMERATAAKCSSTKVERRIIEKNRRNQMKFLCSKLFSLLPIHDCKEAQTVADRIDEAINYIKLLETKLSKSKENKERLLGRKRSHKTTISEASLPPKHTKINIREMGSSVDVVLTSGLEKQSIFYEVIRIFHDEQANVVQASCSVVGNTVFHTVRGELAASRFGAAKITEKLNRLVNGCSGEGEFQEAWWDLDFVPQNVGALNSS